MQSIQMGDGCIGRGRWRALNCVPKNSSSVAFFRSRPNHSGSPLSKLLATAMNFVVFPKKISPTPRCRSAGFLRCAFQRSGRCLEHEPSSHLPQTRMPNLMQGTSPRPAVFRR